MTKEILITLSTGVNVIKLLSSSLMAHSGQKKDEVEFTILQKKLMFSLIGSAYNLKILPTSEQKIHRKLKNVKIFFFT
jgi:hypothetical protein